MSSSDVADVRVVAAHDDLTRGQVVQVELTDRNRALMEAGYLRELWPGEAEATAAELPAATLVRGREPATVSTPPVTAPAAVSTPPPVAEPAAAEGTSTRRRRRAGGDDDGTADRPADS